MTHQVIFMLSQLRLAINGEVVMTEELQDGLDDIYDARVPAPWTFTVAGDEFSWILPTLGLWFSSLLMRDEQDRTWLMTGRPNTYWLTGFFNPQGMLTAMKQEVCRKHQKDANKWALDDISYHTEVTQFERIEAVKTAPAEGCYIHGLFLEGGAWSRDTSQLVRCCCCCFLLCFAFALFPFCVGFALGLISLCFCFAFAFSLLSLLL
jgi:dynein heavy chain